MKWRATPFHVSSPAAPTPSRVTTSRAAGLAQWAIPILALVVAPAAAVAALGTILARQSDESFQVERRDSLRGAIEEFRTVFADLTLRRAADIAALGWTAMPQLNLEIGNKLAPAGLSRYRHERAYLVDAAGGVLASFPPGDVTIPLSARRLAVEFRINDIARRAATSTTLGLYGEDITPVTTDLVLVDGRPALAAIATVRTSTNSVAQGREAPILLSIARVDLRLLGVFEQTSGVTDLRLVDEPAAGSLNVLSLIDRNGRIVGWLAWRAMRPAMDALHSLAPAFIVTILGLLAIVSLSVWRTRRSNHDLAESERRARSLADVDVLTSLPNRRRMLALLDQALQERKQAETVTFAFLDLDGFREINDALSHYGGDLLLAAVARRLETALGASATVGRFGGDEFAAVMTATDPQAAWHASDLIVAAMARPFTASGQSIQIGVSIGLAQAPANGVGRDDLTRRADLALRAAKRRRRGGVIAFEAAMEKEFHDLHFIKRELRRALDEDALTIHYQPIVTAEVSRIIGVEALLRWEHPTRGTIPPSVFVAVAEQTGLMDALGEFVLRRALADALRWPDLYIAVNLSPVQVRDRKLVDLVSDVLSQTGIAASRVVLEITEGVLIDNPEEAARSLTDLRALGVRIALDDFGVGYSSLSYLQRFPFDKLKIDKGFVGPLGRTPNGGAIVQAIVALGRALGLDVLAEGVETEEQRVLLRLAGCDEMQGYYFANPVSREAIDALLAEIRSRNGDTRLVRNAPVAATPYLVRRNGR